MKTREHNTTGPNSVNVHLGKTSADSGSEDGRFCSRLRITTTQVMLEIEELSHKDSYVFLSSLAGTRSLCYNARPGQGNRKEQQYEAPILCNVQLDVFGKKMGAG